MKMWFVSLYFRNVALGVFVTVHHILCFLQTAILKVKVHSEYAACDIIILVANVVSFISFQLEVLLVQ
jgi:hypothetical protein